MHIPTLSDLRRSLDISEQIEKLQGELASVLGGLSKAVAPAKRGRKPKADKVPKAPRAKRKMSAAGRARIIAAQKARWAKVKAGAAAKSTTTAVKKSAAKGKAAAKKTVAKVKEVLSGGEVSAPTTSRSGKAIKKKAKKGAKK